MSITKPPFPESPSSNVGEKQADLCSFFAEQINTSLLNSPLFTKLITGLEKLNSLSIDETSIPELLKKHVDFPYSENPLLHRIYSQLHKHEDKLELQHLKEAKLEELEGDFVFGNFDIQNSKKDPNAQKHILDLHFIINIFELIFSQEQFRMVGSEGDGVYINILNPDIQIDDQVYILCLFSQVCKSANLELNAFYDLLSIQKGDFQPTIHKNSIGIELLSNNLSNILENQKYIHKDGKFQYHISPGLLEHLGLDIDLAQFNINIDYIFSAKKLQDILTYKQLIQSFFGNTKNDILHHISHYYYNNHRENIRPETRTIVKKDDIKAFPEQAETLIFTNDTTLIKLGESRDDIFFYVLQEGAFLVESPSQKNNSIVLNKKNDFVGEMSIYNSIAGADVMVTAGSKVIKIPQAHLKHMLGINDSNLQHTIMNPIFRKILENTIRETTTKRSQYNILQQTADAKQKLLFGNTSFKDFQSILKQYFDSQPQETLGNVEIITAGKENRQLFLLGAGSEIDFEKDGRSTTIRVNEDTILGEGSFLNQSSRYLPDSSIRMVSGSYKRLDFSNIEIPTAMHEALQLLWEIRANSPIFVS